MGKSSTGIEEYLKKIKPKYYWMVAFLVTAIVEALIFAFTGILGNGKYVIARSDMTQQYLPFIRYFCDAVKGEHSLFYTWGMDLGMGTIGTFAYYTLSPVNLLFLLSSEENTMLMASVVIIFKSSLAAGFFQLFVSKLCKNHLFENILFSVLYALCGFSVIFYFNIIWTDSLYLFPLIMLGAHKLIKENKSWLLILAYSLQFFSNFYMSYSVGIISFVLIAFFYIYTLKDRSKKENVLRAIKYALIVAVSLMITAFVWLPGLYQILINMDPLYTDQNIWQSNPILLLNNMFMGQSQSLSALTPYIYCGVLMIVLIPLYFANKCISKKEKILSAASILFIAATFLIPPMRLFMHAFDSPEMFCYRYSFIFSFVICLIACRQFAYIRKSNIKIVGITLVVYSAIFAIASYIYNTDYSMLNNCNTVICAVINAAFIALWLLVILTYKHKKFDLLTVRMIALLLTGAELIINGAVCVPKLEHTSELVDFEAYSRFVRDNTFEQIKQNDNDLFYRIDYVSRRNRNMGLVEDIASVSYFNSVENMMTNRALKNLGIRRSIHLIDGTGLTPITDSLLGVKYRINGDIEMINGLPYYTYDLLENDAIADREYGNYLYTDNSRSLSLGYMVKDDIRDYIFEKSPFENLDNLLSTMTGETITCYEEAGASLSGDKGIFSFVNQNENQEYLPYFDGATNVTYLQHEEGFENEEAVFTFKLANDERPLYAYLFEHRFTGQSLKTDIATITTKDETELLEYRAVPIYIAPSRLFRVGHNDENEYEFSIVLPDYVVNEYYEEPFFAYYDDSELQKAYDILSEHQWQLSVFEDGHVKGAINAAEDGVMFTSIPYDEGWSVYVDGVLTQKEALLEGAFIGVNLTEGDHEIEMIYETPLINEGAAASMAGILVVAFILLAEFYFSRKMERVLSVQNSEEVIENSTDAGDANSTRAGVAKTDSTKADGTVTDYVKADSGKPSEIENKELIEEE